MALQRTCIDACRHCLIYHWLALVPVGPVAAQPAAQQVPAPAELLLYEVRINHQEFGVATVLRSSDGVLHAARADLEKWRLQPPSDTPVVLGDEKYYPLNALQGYKARVDLARQSLDLEFDATAFITSQLGSDVRAAPLPATRGWGGFANYDLFATRTSTARPGSVTRVDGLIEGVLFSPRGSLFTNALAQNLTGSGEPAISDTRRRLIRLETNWTSDFPRETASLQLGDTIGKGGAWGRPVRYGGLRWSTNFATQPGFVTLPMPSLGGAATLPSTTELYIDGVLRQRGELLPGPFQLNNLPVVNGQGQAVLVVHDLLGREQVITQPYYASSVLLKEGLRDVSYEAGFVRNDFGIRDNRYGPAFGALTWRQGFTDSITGEFRAEALRGQQTVGITASAVTPIAMVATGSMAFSRAGTGSGSHWVLAADRHARSGGFGVRSEWTSPLFVQLDSQPGRTVARQLITANAGFFVKGIGSLGLSYVSQRNRGIPDVSIIGANYSRQLGSASSLIFSATSSRDQNRTTSINVTFISALSDRVTAVANRNNASQTQVQVQQALPVDSGYGYRLLAANDSSGTRAEAGVSMQTDTGNYTVEAGKAQDIITTRVSASGGAGLIGGRWMRSQKIYGAFAIVEVPEHPNLGIYLNNQVVTRTNSQGLAILPRLQPYQDNPISIDPAGLSLDSQIDATEVNPVPYFRSGLEMKFPVKRAVGALIILTIESGEFMPIGSVVSIERQTTEFPVAERGEVYVTGLSAFSRLQARWRGQTCTFSVEYPSESGPLPTLGPFRCDGVKR